MFLEIVTPEAVILSSEVTSVAVPGVNGEFQMLNNHASVISLLRKGTVKIEGNTNVEKQFQDRFFKTDDGRLGINISSGTLEMTDNKAIILAD